MSGERRPRPDDQVREALTAAKAVGLPFDEAWPLATDGHVCDSYTSARGSQAPPAQGSLDGPPNLRASAGQKRCAGCRFVHGAGSGLARCTLYSEDVFAGVLWPHRTHERHEWRNALLGDPDEADDQGTRHEWQASYEGTPSRYSILHEMLRARAEQEGTATVYDVLVLGGTLAA